MFNRRQPPIDLDQNGPVTPTAEWLESGHVALRTLRQINRQRAAAPYLHT
jgi:hypothetical protein